MLTNQARILLVEDEEAMRQMMSAYLNKRNYHLTVARDGLEAKAALNSDAPFDLVLSDIRMPGADGMEVLQAASTMKRPPAVILMTAYANVENVIGAMRQGAYGYVKKPIMDLDGELGLLITRALAERQLRHENETLMAKLKQATTTLANRQRELNAEIEMAGHIQRSLLPDELITPPGITFATRRLIGAGVSGEFYDIIPLKDERIGIVMGAALGRDLPAAILMASITGHLRELARSGDAPARVLEKADANLRPILEKGYKNFVTAFYGIISANRKTLTYSCAGQPAPLLIHQDRPVEILPQPPGPFLGKQKSPAFTEMSCPLEPHDRLFWFTDNVRELTNRSGRELTIQHLVNWLSEHTAGSSAAAITHLAEKVTTWDHSGIKRSHTLLMIADIL